MKKLLSVIAAVGLFASSMPFAASAKEYELYPAPVYNEEHFLDESYLDEFAEGIKSGKYYVDFNCDGKFDILDGYTLMAYYAERAATPPEEWSNQVWENKECFFSFSGKSIWANYLFKNYDVYEDDTPGGMPYIVKYSVTPECCELITEYINDNYDVYGHMSSIISLLMSAHTRMIEKGDADLSGSVDASDASAVLSYYAGKSINETYDKITEDAMAVIGDVNGDGKIDADDASRILAIYAENSTHHD